MLFGIKQILLHECSGNMKIYSPRKIMFPSGKALGKYDFSLGKYEDLFPQKNHISHRRCPREIDFPWGNRSSYLSQSWNKCITLLIDIVTTFALWGAIYSHEIFYSV